MYLLSDDVVGFTELEIRRYNEIAFCFFIRRLLSLNNLSTTKTHELIDILGELANCNPFVYKDLINICMMNDNRYMPRKDEQIIIARKLGMSVRETTNIVKVSQTTYYNVIKEEQPLTPKFSIEQHDEMCKLLENINTLIPERSFCL